MSKETDKATPRPWQIAQYGNEEPASLIGIVKGDTTIALLGNSDHKQGNIAANAALIIRAVNSYDKLVEACEADLRLMGNLLEDLERIAGPAVISGIMGRMRLTRATLALAKGEVKL